MCSDPEVSVRQFSGFGGRTKKKIDNRSKRKAKHVDLRVNNQTWKQICMSADEGYRSEFIRNSISNYVSSRGSILRTNYRIVEPRVRNALTSLLTDYGLTTVAKIGAITSAVSSTIDYLADL